MRARTFGAVCCGAALLAVAAGVRRRADAGPVVRWSCASIRSGTTPAAASSPTCSPRVDGRVRFRVVRTNGSVALTARSRGSCGSWNRHWRWMSDHRLQRGCARPADYRVGRRTIGPRRRSGSDRAPRYTGRSARGRCSSSRRSGMARGHSRGAAARGRPPQRCERTRVRDPPLPQRAARRDAAGHGTTVDVAGGWFDAGDYLKFSGTASFTDLILLFTLREYGAQLPAAAALSTRPASAPTGC